MKRIDRIYLALGILLVAGVAGSLLTPLDVDPRIGTFSAGLTVGILIALYALRLADLGETKPEESTFLDFHGVPNKQNVTVAPPDPAPAAGASRPTTDRTLDLYIASNELDAPVNAAEHNHQISHAAPGAGVEHDPAAESSVKILDQYRQDVVDALHTFDPEPEAQPFPKAVPVPEPGHAPDPSPPAPANNILNFDPVEVPEPEPEPAPPPVVRAEVPLEERCVCACNCDKRSKGGLTDLCGNCIRWWQQQSIRCKCDYTTNQYCTCGAIRHGLRVSEDGSKAA